MKAQQHRSMSSYDEKMSSMVVSGSSLCHTRIVNNDCHGRRRRRLRNHYSLPPLNRVSYSTVFVAIIIVQAIIIAPFVPIVNTTTVEVDAADPSVAAAAGIGCGAIADDNIVPGAGEFTHFSYFLFCSRYDS